MARLNIIIWILIAVILCLWFYASPVKGQSARIVDLPELVACSCDSAYRCMSDEDYMLLVGWNEENKYLWNCNDCR